MFDKEGVLTNDPSEYNRFRSSSRHLDETLRENAMPKSLSEGDAFTKLAQAYKQINAPLGDLGMDALTISTAALAGDNQTYTALENQITAIAAERNAIAAQMIRLLNDAEFNGKRISDDSAERLVDQAKRLLEQVRRLRGNGKDQGAD
jgi:hypothetical protein